VPKNVGQKFIRARGAASGEEQQRDVLYETVG